MKISPRTFYFDLVHYATSFKLTKIEGPMPAAESLKVGERVSLDEIRNVVANGNRVVLEPNPDYGVFLQNGSWLHTTGKEKFPITSD